MCFCNNHYIHLHFLRNPLFQMLQHLHYLVVCLFCLNLQPKYILLCYHYFLYEFLFLLFQLHSMILVLYQHHIIHAALLCDSRTNPFVSHVQKSPSWKLMSKGEREITSKLNPSYRGRRREYSGGESFSTRRK